MQQLSLKVIRQFETLSYRGKVSIFNPQDCTICDRFKNFRHWYERDKTGFSQILIGLIAGLDV
jgi:hypothetical protein